MGIDEGIRKHGFRRWYERQLVESHLWLVTMVLALVMMASGWELLTLRRSLLDLVWDAVLLACGAAISLHSWRRYVRTMTCAEAVGRQASCPHCAHYGFRVARDVPPSGAASGLVADCRRCGHRWTIDTEL